MRNGLRETNDVRPKAIQRAHRCPKGTEAAKRTPNGSHRSPKTPQRDPKGRPMGAQGFPKGATPNMGKETSNSRSVFKTRQWFARMEQHFGLCQQSIWRGSLASSHHVQVVHGPGVCNLDMVDWKQGRSWTPGVGQPHIGQIACFC